MKKKLIVVVALSTLLSAGAMLASASRSAANHPGGLETVTLRIEGMT